MMFDAVLESPVGRLGVRLSNRRLEAVRFIDSDDGPGIARDPLTGEVVAQLEAYFGNPLHRFSLPLRLQGTAFQTTVWSALRSIPAGEVRTYGELARKLGTSARALGNACRSNPCPVVVPCHRVVAASGPGGYAGAVDGEKLRIKRWLLEHEGVSINWP